MILRRLGLFPYSHFPPHSLFRRLRRHLPLWEGFWVPQKTYELPTKRSCPRAIDNRPYKLVGCVSLYYSTPKAKKTDAPSPVRPFF